MATDTKPLAGDAVKGNEDAVTQWKAPRWSDQQEDFSAGDLQMKVMESYTTLLTWCQQNQQNASPDKDRQAQLDTLIPLDREAMDESYSHTGNATPPPPWNLISPGPFTQPFAQMARVSM